MELRQLTVMFCDRNVIVDGILVKISATPPSPEVRCIQWQKTWGWVEYEPLSGKPNLDLAGEKDYEEWVVPYITIWEKEKARLEAIEQAEKDAYNAPEERADRLRRKRDKKMKKTDFIVAADYMGMTVEEKAPWLEYRQALRDFPKREGFPFLDAEYGYPWGVGGDDRRAPWPTPPATPTIRGINDLDDPTK